MRIPILAFVGVVLFWVTGASGQRIKDDPWNPEHINSLPAEVRAAILSKCPTLPTAGHYFATYFRDQINLHFELFHCESPKASFCDSSGCLHQVYKLTGGHYRLAKSFYGPGND
jgi:hypothetical protein